LVTITRELPVSRRTTPVNRIRKLIAVTPWTWIILILGLSLVRVAHAQAEYRNLDAGLPVRVEDATVTERYGLDLDFLNLRYDELSGLRTRFQYEPRVSYGILPRTEMWLRTPLYYRERTTTPRKGIGGVGLGGMYQLTQETLGVPGVAIASEAFFPTGPGALPPAYSLKALVTRSLSGARVHLNARVASFMIRPVALNCQPLPGGTVCDGGNGGLGEGTLPPLDGPCTIAPQSIMPVSLACASPTPSTNESVLAVPGRSVTHAAWMVGIAADRTLPLRSVLFVADIFAERFEGIGRTVDLTVEVGARKQFSPAVVLLGGVGRHFRGTNNSSFLVLGATYSRALQAFWSRS
jgi:hypothetical protein